MFIQCALGGNIHEELLSPLKTHGTASGLLPVPGLPPEVDTELGIRLRSKQRIRDQSAPDGVVRLHSRIGEAETPRGLREISQRPQDVLYI